MKITEKEVETVVKKDKVLEISNKEFNEVVAGAARKFVKAEADNPLEVLAFTTLLAKFCAIMEHDLFDSEEKENKEK